VKISVVALTGFMGAGKTSVGRHLAEQLRWPFVDLDERIVQAAGTPVDRIFAERGQPDFRRLETQELRRLLDEAAQRGPRVTALGGGTVAEEDNRRLLAQPGVTLVFLDAPEDELWRRAAGHGRPLAQDEEQFRRLYRQRRPRYLQAALRVETGGRSVQEVAAEVASRLRLEEEM
jgi:shikimate kinase